LSATRLGLDLYVLFARRLPRLEREVLLPKQSAAAVPEAVIFGVRLTG
jgi:hypothetical protein